MKKDRSLHSRQVPCPRALKLETIPSVAVRLPPTNKVALNMSLEGAKADRCFQTGHCVLLC